MRGWSRSSKNLRSAAPVSLSAKTRLATADRSICPSGRRTAVAPAVDQCVADFRILGQHGVAGAVGIQQAGTELDEHLGHERFAAGDAAD